MWPWVLARAVASVGCRESCWYPPRPKQAVTGEKGTKAGRWRTDRNAAPPPTREARTRGPLLLRDRTPRKGRNHARVPMMTLLVAGSGSRPGVRAGRVEHVTGDSRRGSNFGDDRCCEVMQARLLVA